MSIKRVTAAVLAAGVGVTGAVLGSTTATGSESADLGAVSEAAFDVRTSPVAKVPSPTARSFRAFREQAASPMPADAAAAAASGSRFGRNPNLARKIATPAGPGWVVPGASVICLVVPDPVDGYGTSCVPTDWAAERGVVVGMRSGADGRGPGYITALVPDGAEAVRESGQKPTHATGLPGVVSTYVEAAEDLVISR